MRLPALLLVLLLVGAAPAAAPRATVRVPLAIQSDHLFVEVQVDGSEPLRFVLDTGGGELLDSAVARRLGLALSGRQTISGVGDAPVAAARTTAAQVWVGGAVLRNVEFVVLPIDATFGVAEGLHIDGMIGPALLERFVATFDPAGGTLSLDPPGSGAPGEVPLTIDRDDHPLVACAVGGIETQCLLDTGSRLAVSLPRPFLLAHPQVIPRALSAEGVDGYGIGGPARGKLGRVTVTLGGRTVEVVGDFTTQQRGAFAHETYGGNVGGRLLRRFVVTLDYGRKRARFAPSSQADAVDRIDRSGMFLIRRDGKTIALDARPATPAAAAGVRDGDEIVSIDGVPASALALDEIRGRLSAAPGTRVALRVRAGGVERTAALALDDYVPRGAIDHN